MKALIIDDERPVRIAISKLGQWGKYQLEQPAQVENGKDALSAMYELRPSIVFVDIQMPVMNGLEFLEKATASFPDTAYIIISGYDDFSYAQSALKLFASDYLLKPFGDGELEQAVNNALDKRKKTQEREEKAGDDQLPELVLNKGDKSKYVMAAVDYITEHYENPELCVSEIAEHVGISEGHLSHTFKKETDYTVAAYITRVRMRTAMKLLNDCRNKVYEVAEQVGYRDIAHFSSSFKRIVGVTPSEYQDRSLKR